MSTKWKRANMRFDVVGEHACLHVLHLVFTFTPITLMVKGLFHCD